MYLPKENPYNQLQKLSRYVRELKIILVRLQNKPSTNKSRVRKHGATRGDEEGQLLLTSGQCQDFLTQGLPVKRGHD